MASSLPERIDPRRLARAGESLTGRLRAEVLDRLRAVMVTDSADLELRFGMLDSGMATIEGRVSASGTVACQRCLEPMPLALASAVRLAVIDPGETLPSEGGYETVEAPEGTLSLSALVEDELLLAIPDYPTHALGTCEPAAGDAGPDEEEPRESPFAILASLKAPRRNEEV